MSSRPVGQSDITLVTSGTNSTLRITSGDKKIQTIQCTVLASANDKKKIGSI